MMTFAMNQELRKRFSIKHDNAPEWFRSHYLDMACTACGAQPGELCSDPTYLGRIQTPGGWHGERGEAFHARCAEWKDEYEQWQANYDAYINAYIKLATSLTVALSEEPA